MRDTILRSECPTCGCTWPESNACPIDHGPVELRTYVAVDALLSEKAQRAAHEAQSSLTAEEFNVAEGIPQALRAAVEAVKS